VNTIRTTLRLPLTIIVAVAETVTAPLTVEPGAGCVRHTCTLYVAVVVVLQGGEPATAPSHDAVTRNRRIAPAEAATQARDCNLPGNK
jgi:hypothetical protein